MTPFISSEYFLFENIRYVLVGLMCLVAIVYLFKAAKLYFKDDDSIPVDNGEPCGMKIKCHP